MTIKGKLIIILVVIGLILGLVAGFMIWSSLKNMEKVNIVNVAFSDLQAAAKLRLTINRQMKEAMDYFMSLEETNKKKFEKYGAEAEQALNEWIKTEKKSREVVSEKGNAHIVKTKDVEKTYNMVIEMVIKAFELAKIGDREEAFKLIEKKTEPWIDDVLFDSIDNIMSDEVKEVEEAYNELLLSIALMPWVMEENREQVEIAQRSIHDFLTFDSIYLNINRQMKEIMDYIIYGEEEQKKKGEEYRINAKMALKEWIKKANRGMLIGDDERKKFEIAMDTGEKYIEVLELIETVYELKKDNQTEEAFGFMEERVETIVEDVILPRITMAINDIRTKIADTNHKLLDMIFSAVVYGIVVITIISLFIFFLFLRLIREMIASLNKLKKGTEIIGMGRLDYRIDLKSRDEFGELASSFNRMTEDLQRTTVSQDYMDNIFRSMIDSLIVISPDGIIKSVNQATLNLSGYREDELIGRSIGIICEEKDMFKWMDYIIKESFIGNVEKVYISKDGKKIPIAFSASVMYNNNGEVSGIVCGAKDITERKMAENALREIEEEKKRINSQIFRNSNEGILITDPHANIIDVNSAFCRITGYTPEEVKGKKPGIMKSGRHDAEFYKNMWATLAETGEWQGEIWNRRKNGELYPKWLSISAVKDNKNRLTHYIGIFDDITKIKKTEEHIHWLAYHDVLTNLPNRTLFQDRLQQALNQSARNKLILAVMFFDINRFKNINDTLGHHAGDKLLTNVGKRLSDCIRKVDTAARIAGDEFTIILPDIINAHSASLVAQRIIDALSMPFTVDGHEIFITVSIGITIYPFDGEGIDVLVKNANTAMYHAKQQGKNNYLFYSGKMNINDLDVLTMETELRHGLERKEFLLYYQPRVDSKTKQIIGMEALIRWRHPELGMVSPGEFIPIAEETGLIIPIGEWVLHTACEQTRSWHIAGFPSLCISVNLSGLQFKQQNLIEMIDRVLKETGLDCNCLELEITESIIMEDAESTLMKLCELKNMGIHLSIDDFGTGYSSLTYLKRFPIDILKIDQSFVRDITSDPDDSMIVQTIITMAHSLKMKVIAEGVETAEQLSFLQSHQCDEIQGYYFSRPIAAEPFTQLLQEWKHSPLIKS
ncbi:MAG: EAL domain-containing protein [Nitrospirota bacterium]